jgi:segregation and condensation protein A
MIGAGTHIYQVTLPVFEGPLDLLLHLIEREELDITQVSLAQVTNQYLDYLAQLSERDPENLADFLVVAAKLLLIKSRVLLPQPPALATREPDDVDVGDDLVRQLVEYKKFKEVASWLQEMEAQGVTSYVRIAPAPSLERTADVGDVTLDDLLAVLREVLAVPPPAASVNGAVPPITITIADQMDLIARETASGQAVSFRGLLKGASSRLHIIVTLLALLEMIKQLRVTVKQDRLFGDILIQKRVVAENSGMNPASSPDQSLPQPGPDQQP